MGFAARLELLGVIRNQFNSNSANSNSGAILAALAWRGGFEGASGVALRGGEPGVPGGIGRDWDYHSRASGMAIPIPTNLHTPELNPHLRPDFSQ